MGKEQEKMMRKKGYLTVRKAADAAGVGRSTMYEWLDGGWVSGKRVGKTRYVSVASLRDYLGGTLKL